MGIDEVETSCLSPEKCGNDGKNAASIVMAKYTAPYCTVNGVSTTSAYTEEEQMTIQEQCKDLAISTCKTFLPDAFKQIYDISTCADPPIGNALTFDQLDELKKECEKMVD